MGNRKIYRQIAKDHGVSPKEVKADMQAAINYAYNNTSNDEITKAYQDQVPRKGSIPTSEEFISYAVKKLKTCICILMN